jgi:hypothetical protein
LTGIRRSRTIDFRTEMIALLRLCVVARHIAVLAFVAGLAVPDAAGQSLADVARKEEARRKTGQGTVKVYTNDDLRPVPATTAPPGPATAGSAPAAAVPSPAAPSPAAAVTPAADAVPAASSGAAPAGAPTVKDQAYWSGRMRQLRTQLERDETYVEALQSRINALTTDFVNRDDPAQRAVVERDRQRAIAELDRLKLQIEDDKQAIADFEEEARRASVPPGWLRQ